MKRRVIKQGNNTLTLTLPRSWTTKFDIAAGDDLTVIQQDKGLIINSDKISLDKKIEIDISNLPVPLILRYIVSAYRSGFDEIKIIFGDDKLEKIPQMSQSFTWDYMFRNETRLNKIDVVQIIVNRLIGMAVVDQGEKYCVIKELSDTSYREFDAAMRRMFLLLLSMAEECNTAINKKSYELLNNVHNIDYNFNRFNDFALRVLNKKGYEKFKKTPIVFSYIFLLELIADEYKKLALHLKEFKKVGKEINKAFNIQYNQLRSVYEIFYKFEKNRSVKIFMEDIKGDKINREIFLKLNNQDQEMLHHLKKIGIYVMSLLELSIDLNI
ncbi:hypothetical protein ACFL1H_01555 [Nanoarchaeota archaeon]